MIWYLTFHVICGVFAYGLFFAVFQKGQPERAEEDYKADRTISLILAAIGPTSLVASLILSAQEGWFKHGLKFK